MHEILTTVDFTSFVQTFDLNAWDWDSFFKNGKNVAKTFIGGFIGILGVILFGFAAVYLFKVASNKQQRGGHVMEAVIALAIGGLMVFGGYSVLNSMAEGGYDTVNKLGE